MTFLHAKDKFEMYMHYGDDDCFNKIIIIMRFKSYNLSKSFILLLFFLYLIVFIDVDLTCLFGATLNLVSNHS